MRLTEGERHIMELLWENGPMSAKELVAVLWERIEWKKTTTYTMLSRCVEKGMIRREDPGFRCVPIITRESVKLEETQRLIETEYGGNVDLLMTALIGQGQLSAAKLRKLYETLEKMEEDA